MANCQEAWVKTNKYTIKQIKICSKKGTTLKIAKKNFQDEELPHELFLTTRQKTKIRNAFANNVDEYKT